MKPDEDDFDLPEDVPEPVRPAVIQAEDLHLGPAQVKENPWLKDPNWYIKRHGPKPPGLGSQALDVLTLTLAVFFIIMEFKVVYWLFTT